MKKIILTISTLLLVLSSCVTGDDYGTPDLTGECVDKVANTTVQTLVTNATSTVTKFTSTTEAIIEAYVTSSDEGGNFYKSLSLVTLDGNYGFSVPIDAYNLYNDYKPGRKVYIKINDLYYYNNPLTSSLEIGELLENGAPLEDEVGRISGVNYKDIILRSCEKVDEETIVKHLTIPQALNNSNLNKLIEFDDVQFAELNIGKPYYDANNTAGSGTNNVLTDENGNQIYVRVSEFVNFGTEVIPSLKGKVRGVLTKYNGDYQFMIRTLNDVNLTETRYDANPPLGGTNIQYLGSFLENFETYTSGSVSTGQRIFPKYVNDAAEGGNYWYCESFSGNKYLKMSAFSNNPTYQFPVNRVYFIVPVDFTAANSMSFKTQDRFNVGGVLKVYYSTNYVPLGNVDDATLVNITSNFSIATGNTGSSSQPFVNSGIYNFPSTLTGNGYILFEYTGGYSFNPDLTTTMHIDDILIN